jgi:predicted RNase H-like HicB family nuclease
MQLTAIIEQGENSWLVGQIEEIPAVISQGKTVEELKANLLDALGLILKTE